MIVSFLAAGHNRQTLSSSRSMSEEQRHVVLQQFQNIANML